MACWAQQAQPETRPELARCCQKELLLNVRGFASTQKRDFNAFVEWISLPAHQILSVNSPPHPTHTPTAMQWRPALRPAETRVQLPHGCQAEIKLSTTELTVTQVTWQTVLDTEGYAEENTEWVRGSLYIADMIRTLSLSLKRIYSSLIWTITGMIHRLRVNSDARTGLYRNNICCVRSVGSANSIFNVLLDFHSQTQTA